MGRSPILVWCRRYRCTTCTPCCMDSMELRGLFSPMSLIFVSLLNLVEARSQIIIITCPICFKYFGHLTWHVHSWLVGWLVGSFLLFLLFFSLYIKRKPRMIRRFHRSAWLSEKSVPIGTGIGGRRKEGRKEGRSWRMNIPPSP